MKDSTKVMSLHSEENERCSLRRYLSIQMLTRTDAAAREITKMLASMSPLDAVTVIIEALTFDDSIIEVADLDWLHNAISEPRTSSQS